MLADIHIPDGSCCDMSQIQNLIDPKLLEAHLINHFEDDDEIPVWRMKEIIEAQITQPVIHVPCNIGDFVWAIRTYQGVPKVQQGRVSEMHITKEGVLSIVVSHIARGPWGLVVFPTQETAQFAIDSGQYQDRFKMWWENGRLMC